MVLNEQDITRMVKSCLNRLLEGLIKEISSADAYRRFYSEKIDENVWNILMTGTKNITPFHKRMAEFIIEYPHQAERLAKLASSAWAKGTVVQQFLVNAVKENYYPFTNDGIFTYLERIVNGSSVDGRDRHTEEDFLDGGLVRIYEDDTLLVTCTLSYTASHKYYHDSRWCTASGIDGRYNGFEMFRDYSVDNRAILLQFVDKENRSGSYQMAIRDANDVNQICDFGDYSCSINVLYRQFGKERVDDILNNVDCRELRELTSQYVNVEQRYYDYKRFKYTERMKKILSTKIRSQECINATIEYLKKEFPYNDDVGVTPLFEYVREYDAKNGIAAISIYYTGHDRSKEEKYNIFTEEDRDAAVRLGDDIDGSIGASSMFINPGTLDVLAIFPLTRISICSGVVALLEEFRGGRDDDVVTPMLVSMENGKIIGKYPGCVVTLGSDDPTFGRYYGGEYVDKFIVFKRIYSGKIRVMAVIDEQGKVDDVDIIFTWDNQGHQWIKNG